MVSGFSHRAGPVQWQEGCETRSHGGAQGGSCQTTGNRAERNWPEGWPASMQGAHPRQAQLGRVKDGLKHGECAD